MRDNSNIHADRSSLPGKRELARRLKKHVRKQLEKIEEGQKDWSKKNNSDAVHDVRVATRRLGTVLDVVAFSSARKAAKKACKRLKKLRHVLSAPRDTDVVLGKIRERAKAGANSRRAQLWNLVIRKTRDESEAARAESNLWLKDFDLSRLERRVTKIVRCYLKDGFFLSDLGGAADAPKRSGSRSRGRRARLGIPHASMRSGSRQKHSAT
jgi:CHAD domain-containing protein